MAAQKKYGAVIYKPVKAYKEYRKILKYFSARTLIEYCRRNGISELTLDGLDRICAFPLYTEWENVGGQIVPHKKIEELFAAIKSRKVEQWQQVHDFYDECQKNYEDYKVRYAVYLLELLYSRKITEFSKEIFADIVADVILVSDEMYNSSIASRQKDFTDYFRRMVYRNATEMENVLGSAQANGFLKELKVLTDSFNAELKTVFAKLC